MKKEEKKRQSETLVVVMGKNGENQVNQKQQESVGVLCLFLYSSFFTCSSNAELEVLHSVDGSFQNIRFKMMAGWFVRVECRHRVY